jgi:hypothetical protein
LLCLEVFACSVKSLVLSSRLVSDETVVERVHLPFLCPLRLLVGGKI